MMENMKICLLGASFDTGNLGVSALAESSIKIILNRWPDAEIILLGSGSSDGEHCLKISGREIRVRIERMRFCKNVFTFSFLCFADECHIAETAALQKVSKITVCHQSLC